MNRKQAGRIVLARIGAAHGLQGEVRVVTFTGDPAGIAAYGPLTDESGRLFEIEAMRPGRDCMIVRFAGISDREAAQALRGVDLHVDRSVLPETGDPDEFYLADLVGLEVTDRAGQTRGRIVRIHDFGSGDILEIEAPGGMTQMYLFTRENFPVVDPAAGKVVLEPPVEVESGEGRGRP